MGLFTRNGIFYLEYKQDDKIKRMSLKTKNKGLAHKIYESYLLSQITLKINNNIIIPKTDPEYTTPQKRHNISYSKNVSNAFKEYLNLCSSKNLSHEIIQSKERLMKLFKDKGIKQLNEIKQKFISDIVKENKRDTANRYMKNLQAFLNFCIKKQYYDRMSFESLSFIKQAENIRDITIPEKDYLLLLQRATDRDFALYLQALWETGCRPNEITCLKKSDIDSDKGIAKIYQNKTKKYKIVYFTDELLEKIQALKTEYVFEGFDRQKEYYGKKFRDLKETLGLPKEEPAWFQKREYIRLLLTDTQKNLNTLHSLIHKINSSYEANPKNHNYLLSRKFSFPIGVRNLCLRYTVLCTQIAGFYLANRQFYAFAYEILKLLPFHILEDTLLDTIDIDSIPKYIKDIDISNPNQKYYTAFLGFSELDEHGLILPKIQAWAKRGLSFKAYLKFRNRWEENSPIT